MTAWNPRSANIRPNIRPQLRRRPYGERTRTSGGGGRNGHGRVRGAYRSASRTTPSGIRTRRSRWTSMSRLATGGSLRACPRNRLAKVISRSVVRWWLFAKAVCYGAGAGVQNARRPRQRSGTLTGARAREARRGRRVALRVGRGAAGWLVAVPPDETPPHEHHDPDQQPGDVEPERPEP